MSRSARRGRHAPRWRLFFHALVATAGLVPPAHLVALDCNKNSVDDLEEIASGESPDCNFNDVPDECDIGLSGVEFEVMEVAEPAASAAIADFDGDGRLDIAVVDSENRRGRVLFAGDGGSFEPGDRFVVGGAGIGAASIVAADFDGNGSPDLAVERPRDHLLILRNDGTGSFPASLTSVVERGGQTEGLAAGDLDGDGSIDLCVAGIGSARIFRGDGTGSFEPGELLFIEGGNPAPSGAVALADFDGDGDLDVAVANADRRDFRRDVAVFPNSGDATFEEPLSTGVGGWQESLAAADVDGDGHIDLVTANSDLQEETSTVSVVLNDGAGSLHAGLDFEAGSNPRQLALGDMDGDGDVDAAVLHRGGNTVTVLRNDSYGNYMDVRDFPASGILSLVATDLEGDGRVDLVAPAEDILALFLSRPAPSSRDCNQNGVPDECEISRDPRRDCDRSGLLDSCEVAAGEALDCDENGLPDECDVRPGAISFRGPTTARLNEGMLATEHALVAADLDGDGTPDLAVTSSVRNKVSVLESIGQGLLSPPKDFPVRGRALSVVSADFDLDGRLDLAVARAFGVDVLSGLGGGRFAAPRSFDTDRGNLFLETSDFDNDGDADLAVASDGTDDVWILLGDGAGAFELAGRFDVLESTVSIGAGDLDGDGHQDLVVGDRFRLATLLFGSGDGRFDESRRISSNPGGGVIGLGDVDGDGDLDLAVAGVRLGVILNEGDGSFGEGSEIDVAASPDFVNVADMDGDGSADLVTGNAVFWNDGTGGFSEFSFHGAGKVDAVALGDFDGNGLLDVSRAVQGSVSVFLGREGRVFGPPGTVAVGREAERLTLGDFDGDGVPDAVVTAPRIGEIAVLPGRVDGLLGSPRRIPAGVEPSAIASADLDSDSFLDLAVADPGRGEVLLLFGNGNGGFAPGDALDPGGTPQALVAADLDGDGREDLAVTARRTEAGMLAIFANGGGRAFSREGAFPLGDNVASLSTGDLDGDGDADLIAGGIAFDIAYFLGDGAGGFEARTLELDDFIVSAKVGDVNQDGLADVVARELSFGPSTVFRIFRGTSAGDLLPPEPFEVRGTVSDFELLDVDLDGFPELVVGTEGQSNLWVYRSERGSSFRLTEFFRAGPQGAVGLEGADFDLDGSPDLFILNKGAGSASVLLNRSTPATAEDANRDGIPDSCQIAGNDCNGNGIVDDADVAARIAFGDVRLLNSFRQQEGGALADFDGDGDLDLALTLEFGPQNGMVIHRNDGEANFTREFVELPSVVGDVRSGDVDGDGDPDLVGSGIVLRNDGSGNFAVEEFDTPAGGFLAKPLADLDGDGDLDLLDARREPGSVHIVLNAGDGSFAAAGSVASGTTIWNLVAADLDGDSFPDLVTVNRASKSVSIFLNDGSAGFEPMGRARVGELPGDAAAADLDLDGDIDLAVVNGNSADVTVLWNAGDATFDEALTVNLPSGAETLVAADLTGDTLPDLAVEGRLLENLGTGEFAVVLAFVGGRLPRDYLAGDLDGDGDLDLAVADRRERRTPINLNETQPPSSFDCDGDLIPDECEEDCNGNGLLDRCDIARRASADCDANRIPDECDIATGESPDCNGNGIPDSCDIASGRSRDDNATGVPDECEPRFHRGDPNNDGETNITDGIYLIDYMLLGGPAPTCMDSGDVNNDERIDIADGIYLISFLFRMGSPPPDPGPVSRPCGVDPDPPGPGRDLGCEFYDEC